MSEERTYNENRLKDGIKCGLSSNYYWHICKDPIQLKCKHFVCKSCIPMKLDYRDIRCKLLHDEAANKQELLLPNEGYKKIVENNLKEIFNIMFDDMNTKIKDVRFNMEQKYELLQIEMEKLADKFEKYLERKKEKWKLDNNLMNFENLKNDINKLNDEQGFTEVKIQICQEKLIELNEIVKTHVMSVPVIKFNVSTSPIKQKMFIKSISKTSDEYVEEMILKRAKQNRWEKRVLNQETLALDYLCILPNGNLLISNYKDSKLYLYGNEFQFIREVTELIGYKILCFTTNNKDSIYFTIPKRKKILKTSLEFKKLCKWKETSDSCNLFGICYDIKESQVYVCDYKNCEIKVFDENLIALKYYYLDFAPRYIKIVDNYVCVNSNDFICFIKTTYFHNSNESQRRKSDAKKDECQSDNIEHQQCSFEAHDEFDNCLPDTTASHVAVISDLAYREINEYQTDTIKYRGHHGAIGASKSYFYEFDYETKTLYVYDNLAYLIETMTIEDLDITSLYPENIEYSSICVYKDQLLICNGTNILVLN